VSHSPRSAIARDGLFIPGAFGISCKRTPAVFSGQKDFSGWPPEWMKSADSISLDRRFTVRPLVVGGPHAIKAFARPRCLSVLEANGRSPSAIAGRPSQ